MRSRYPLFLATACALLIAACGGRPPLQPPLPVGIQTMTGTLLPAELSTIRRGTHLLTSENERLCFVESTLVNLRSFEGRNIVIRGLFEANSDPSLLPVLVAQEVTGVEQDSIPFSLPSYGLRGTIPRTWLVATQQESTIILLENSSTPLITITESKQTPLPSVGAPLLVSGHHATRQQQPETGGERVSVEWEADLIHLTFTPPAEATDKELLRAQWHAFVTSLSSASLNTQSSSAASEAASGTPCGGSAGILCPSGEYCAITDVTENIGRCRSVNR